MGVVYLGRDEALDRDVAIKTLRVEGSPDDESRGRFEIEAKAAARLQHPNIVTVFELGEDRGLPFIAMELLGGQDLETLLRSGERLSATERLDIVIQTLRGLDFAHAHQIVHRDIKPSNLRVLDDGGVKILDFGIAKVESTSVTRAGMMVGTPYYMSPEHIRGGALDGRTDVFAVGVILHELFAGKRPFMADDPTRVLYRIVNEPHPRLPLESAGPLTAEVQRVIDKSLEKQADDRFGSAALMADELTRVRERYPAPHLGADEVAALSLARKRLAADHADETTFKTVEAIAIANPDATEAQRLVRLFKRKPGEAQAIQETTAFPELDATFGKATAEGDDTVASSQTVSGSAATITRAGGRASVTSEPLPESGPSSDKVLYGAIAAFVVTGSMAAFLYFNRATNSESVSARPTPTITEIFVPGAEPAPQAEAAGPTPARPAPVVPKTMIEIRSQPPGATIRLDRKSIGVTPPKRRGRRQHRAFDHALASRLPGEGGSGRSAHPRLGGRDPHPGRPSGHPGGGERLSGHGFGIRAGDRHGQGGPDRHPVGGNSRCPYRGRVRLSQTSRVRPVGRGRLVHHPGSFDREDRGPGQPGQLQDFGERDLRRLSADPRPDHRGGKSCDQFRVAGWRARGREGPDPGRPAVLRHGEEAVKSAPVLTMAALMVAMGRIAVAQPPRADDQARRLLEDGRSDLANGRARQGLDALQTIVTGFPNSPYADDALLDIGRYAEEVEKNLTRAREVYDQIAKRYPQSDSAPGAYLQMGRIAFATAASREALDDALANFQRVIRLYPESAFVPHALAASASVFRRAGRFDSAIDAARRAVLDHPSGEIAPEAQFELAQSLVMAGDVLNGIEEFQRVRSLYPASAAATRALNATTALYRLYGSDKPVFQKDTAFALLGGEVLKDVRSLAVTPSGVTWIASNKTKSAVAFDPAFKLGASLAAEDPQTLAVSPLGEVVFASKLAVKVGGSGVLSFSIPAEKPGEMEIIDRIGAATMLLSGDMLVSDLKRKRLLRFKGSTFASGFGERAEREVIKLLTTPKGEVVMLRKDDKSVEIVDDGGRLVTKIGPRGPGFEWKKPADVAIDAFSNVYVADEDQGIFMFSAKGALMATFGAADLKKSGAIAIDLSGAALVYDDRTETIVRFK